MLCLPAMAAFLTLGCAQTETAGVPEDVSGPGEAPVVVPASRYGGFEQVGGLPRPFTAANVQMTTGPGDVVLYAGDQPVVFFGRNSWSYTRLGHIRLPEDVLAALLGVESAVIERKVN